MNLSLDKETWKAWLCSSKACLPWTCLYLPLRALLSLTRVTPEKTIWRMGETLRLRSHARLPDGSRLLFRPLTWDHEGIKEVYGYEEYEKVFHIQEGNVVVDVGAHIGIFSVKAARKVGNPGVVIAIEPEEENYSFLIANKKINSLENIIPIYGALADHTGRALLYSWRGHSGGFSIVEKHSSHCVEVPVFTLDNLASKLYLRRIDFLKIDAEGSELEVLKGGRRMLQGASAKIVVAGYHESDDPKKISNFLQSLGYKTACSEDDFICAWK